MKNKIDSIVARVIEDLTPSDWAYSDLTGGLFALDMKIGIDSIEDGSLNGNKGIKNALYYYRTMQGCLWVTFDYDTIVASIAMKMDDKGILLESSSYEGWFGTYCYVEDEEFKPIKIGHTIFYRGKYYKAGDEIPGLKCTIGGYYAIYKR